MNISLLGYGKMGREIAHLATAHNLKISSIVDPVAPEATHRQFDTQALHDADVAIDFSQSKSVLTNIEIAALSHVNLVIGTTGWLSQLSEVEKIVKKTSIGLIYASNFSIGVNFFWQILAIACQKFQHFSEYDVFGTEFHHNQKTDSPSGTTLSSAEIILKNFPSKKFLQKDRSQGKISPDALHFTSTRGGSIPGTHSVFFDSPADTIEITHTARNRSGFAHGALECAKWIQDKKGLFTINDYLKSIL